VCLQTRRPLAVDRSTKLPLKITAGARADPDALPLTAKQRKSMIPMRVLRGRPKSENPKQLVSVRYSPEVLEYFRATGEGWQPRMDRVLREYAARRSRRAS
jgi:uncharacterized protein (DUF4415 family)